FMCLLERVRVICLCVELFINRISVFRFLLPFSTTLIYSLSLHDALPIYLLIKSPEVGRMVPADHPVNGQVFTKAPPTGPADIRVTFTRWNDQYLSCQPVPDQLLPSLTAGSSSVYQSKHISPVNKGVAVFFGSKSGCSVNTRCAAQAVG